MKNSFVGFGSSNATCKARREIAPVAVAPQPTQFKVFGANPRVLAFEKKLKKIGVTLENPRITPNFKT
ncbi:hypothetical protein [Nostoc sp.]|uniref:hypothetical protein n=1 Tax=Nostoc sp. TaxID=1180 RepID=UPI002FFC6269